MNPRPEIVRDSKYSDLYEQQRRQIIEGLIPHGDGMAVDLGCGSGYFTRIIRDRGWRVTGIDAEPSNCALAERYAERVLCGDAANCLAKLDQGSVDLVIALEIIEHLQEREAFLDAIRRVVKPQAHLLISTPNRYSPEGLYGRYWVEKIRRGKQWYAWDETHAHIFSSSEFLALLRRRGWQPQKVIGYHYKSRFSLPITASSRWPMNRFGFDTIVLCQPHGERQIT